MTESPAAALELRFRSFRRSFGEMARTRKVTESAAAVRQFQHMVRVILPVGRHMQHGAGLQNPGGESKEILLDDTPLVVPFLVPGIREKQKYSLKALFRHRSTAGRETPTCRAIEETVSPA